MNEASPVDTIAATEMPVAPPTATPAPAPPPCNIGVLLVNLGTPDTADARGRRQAAAAGAADFFTSPATVSERRAPRSCQNAIRSCATRSPSSPSPAIGL